MTKSEVPAKMAGVYLPRPRQPYGPRGQGRSRYVERAGYGLPAGSAPAHVAKRIAVPMPHGGVRWLVSCPICGRNAARLYLVPASRQPQHYACRLCLGLRYESQYAGRRPEAAPERFAALEARAQRAQRAETAQYRKQMVAVAKEVYARRQQTHAERLENALTVAVLLLLARTDHAWARSWLERGLFPREEVEKAQEGREELHRIIHPVVLAAWQARAHKVGRPDYGECVA